MTEKLYWDNAYKNKFVAKVKSVKKEGIFFDIIDGFNLYGEIISYT